MSYSSHQLFEVFDKFPPSTLFYKICYDFCFNLLKSTHNLRTPMNSKKFNLDKINKNLKLESNKPFDFYTLATKLRSKRSAYHNS